MPILDMSNTLKGIEGSELNAPKLDTDLLATYFKYFEERGLLETLTENSKGKSV